MIAYHIETINSNEKIREIFEIQNIFIFRRIANENDNFNIFRFMTKREFRMKIEFQQFRAKTRVARAKMKVVKKNVEIAKFQNDVDDAQTHIERKFKFIKFEKMRIYQNQNENEHQR